MSLINQQTNLTLRYVYYPDSYGKSDYVYIQDTSNGTYKKKPLNTIYINSVSFYTTAPLPTTSPVPTPLNSASTSISATPLYLCSIYPANIGSINWELSTSSFYGYLKVMVRVNIEGGQPCYTWVECLVSGTLSGTTGAATVSSVNPIYLTSNMSVYTLDTTVSPPVLIPYTNPDTAVLIQSNLKGTITVTFPQMTSCTGTVTAAPLWTWIYNNQYISVAYNPYTVGCKPCP